MNQVSPQFKRALEAEVRRLMEQNVPTKYRKAGYEIYDRQGNYEGFTTDLEEAKDHAEQVGSGAKVVDAKNRKKIVYRAR